MRENGAVVKLEKEGWRDRPTVIFILNAIPDREGVPQYQRVVALSRRFNVVVVACNPIPASLREVVQEVRVVRRRRFMFGESLRVARELSKAGKQYFIYTQYSMYHLSIGYFVKKITGCRWIYDLWDHPSLRWAHRDRLRRIFSIVVWKVFVRRLLRSSDGWVIAMHPTVLATLPQPPVRCGVILVGPGYNGGPNASLSRVAANHRGKPIRVVYAGVLRPHRGLALMLDWARGYSGPKVQFDLVGQYAGAAESLIEESLDAIGANPDIDLNVHGELPHASVIEFLRSCDVGLCPLDPAVLNYRYAYPVKVVEYMVAGLVVVATHGHGIRAFVKDGETGFLSAYDHASFSKAVDRAISVAMDDEVRQSISENSASVVKGMDWRIINETLVSQLERVIGNNRT